MITPAQTRRPEHVGADARTRRSRAGCGSALTACRSDPELVDEAPERGEHRGRVGGTEARDVQEHEDGERDEQPGRPEQHLEQAGAQADDERVERRRRR